MLSMFVCFTLFKTITITIHLICNIYYATYYMKTYKIKKNVKITHPKKTLKVH